LEEALDLPFDRLLMMMMMTRLAFIAVGTVPTGSRICGVVNVWFACLMKRGSTKTYGELDIDALHSRQ